MLLRVCDMETTGMPPDAAVCEIGWCDVRTYAGDLIDVGDPVGMLVNPNRPMPPEARAIHHISDADLVGCPPIATGFIELQGKECEKAGGWLSKIAAAIKPTDKVGAALSEEQVRKFYGR